MAKRVAVAHEAARKTTKKRPSRKRPSRKRPSRKRTETVADDIPNTRDSVLDVGTEFSYNVSFSFIANMMALPYLVVSEKQIRDRLKQELRNAVKDAVKITANSFDMQDPSIILTGVNIESAVNSG